MYKILNTLSRQLQRRSAASSVDTNGSKPLLPETINDNSEGIPAHAYVTLATAVMALSSIGPSLDLQHGVVPVLKILWRQIGTWMVLLPGAAITFYRDGLPRLSRQQALKFICASFFYSIMCIGFVISLQYTSVNNAVIFSNTNALLLLLGRFLVGSSVSFLESAGALTAFFGGIFCTYDESVAAESTIAPHAVPETAPIWVGVLGDLIAVTSALGGTMYLVIASTVRPKFPSVYIYVFMNMITASTITLSFLLLSGEEIAFSRDVNVGVLGFLNLRYDRLPLEMFMVLVCNLVGSMGYLRSTIYFDNLVISVATLMEPTVASALACAVGVGVIPGFLGMVGNMLVALGTIMVISPQNEKKP